MTGSVSRGHENASQSLQMTERPLMSPDELKSMKPGSFIVMKTGAHPFISRLKLFTKWGIAFDKGVFTVPDKAARTVYYACKETILAAVDGTFPNTRPPVGSYKAQGGETMSDHELEPKRSTPVRTSV